jgi:hypothetical protein
MQIKRHCSFVFCVNWQVLLSPPFRKESPMCGLGSSQSRRGFRRVYDRLRKGALISDRQTDDLGLCNGFFGRLMGCGHDKVVHTPALYLGGPLNHGKDVWRNPSLKPCGTG